MKAYLDLLSDVLENGNRKKDRTGTGTLSVFGRQVRFNLKEGFPLLTTKKVHFKSIVHELLWFISGNTNIEYLNNNQVTIWDEWADDEGNLGPVYGAQWRSWTDGSGNSIDQLSLLIERLKKDPDSRRHIVSAWNVSKLDEMALPPCHLLFQFYVNDNELSCQLYQRSADLFLGVPFNRASYSLLTHMVAQQCGYTAGEFIWSAGDVHIYNNHINAAREQLTRDPKARPELIIKRTPDSLFEYLYDDFQLIGYGPHSVIKAPISI